MEDGNFGDIWPIGDGVSESRLDFGPGYRIYFAIQGRVVHLLGGGSKARQQPTLTQPKPFGRHMTKTGSYRESLLQALTDPAEAAAYLNAGLEDSVESFLKALKNVAQARQMTMIAKETGLQRETLYRSLSENGNPTLSTLSSVLDAVGIAFRFIPKPTMDESIIVGYSPTPATEVHEISKSG